MSKYKFKVLMFLFVVIVGSPIVTTIDMAVGLTHAMDDIGFWKSGFHKMGYFLQGMAMAWVISLPDE